MTLIFLQFKKKYEIIVFYLAVGKCSKIEGLLYFLVTGNIDIHVAGLKYYDFGLKSLLSKLRAFWDWQINSEAFWCFGDFNMPFASRWHLLFVINRCLQIVGPFYGFWESYCTAKSYVWCEKYDTRQAPDRFTRRAMEAENKKLCEAKKKERNEEVRVGFLPLCSRGGRKWLNCIHDFTKLNLTWLWIESFCELTLPWLDLVHDLTWPSCLRELNWLITNSSQVMKQIKSSQSHVTKVFKSWSDLTWLDRSFSSPAVFQSWVDLPVSSRLVHTVIVNSLVF